jgi:hypothetical protein
MSLDYSQIPEELLFPYKRPTIEDKANPVEAYLVEGRQKLIMGRPVFIINDVEFIDLIPNCFYSFGGTIMYAQPHPNGGYPTLTRFFPKN